MNMASGRSTSGQRSQNINQNNGWGTQFNEQCGGFNLNANRGQGNGRGQGGNCPICQVCGKMGHTAFVCYHRYEKEFVPNNSNNNTKGTNGGNNSTSINGGKNAPTAMMATQNNNPFMINTDGVLDSSWYVDNGASNNVTTDYSNLNNPMEYKGNEMVTISNGEQLQINFVGSTILSSGNSLLNLKNILYVSNIAKYLITVSKLAQDNHVYIEFHDNCCFVKD